MELVYNLIATMIATLKVLGAVPILGIAILAPIVVPPIIRAMKRW